MGVINKGHTFTSGENVTADKLNNLADDATFNSSSTDGTTLEVANPGGYIKVKDAGIGTTQLADDAVTTDKIADANVTYAKMQNVAANSVIGNPTTSDATPQAITIADLSTNVVAAISDATAHTSDTNSDGINDTGGTDGLMSAEDKTKLDGIATGADIGTVTEVTGSDGISGTVTTSGSLSLAAISNLNVLGNVSGNSASPTSVEIKDEDAMTSDSATALATQQSIKAYVDSQLGSSVLAKCVFQPSGNIIRSTNISQAIKNSIGRYNVGFSNALTDPVIFVLAETGGLTGPTPVDVAFDILTNSSGQALSVSITVESGGNRTDPTTVHLVAF